MKVNINHTFNVSDENVKSLGISLGKKKASRIDVKAWLMEALEERLNPTPAPAEPETTIPDDLSALEATIAEEHADLI